MENGSVPDPKGSSMVVYVKIPTDNVGVACTTVLALRVGVVRSPSALVAVASSWSWAPRTSSWTKQLSDVAAPLAVQVASTSKGCCHW
jgi:hypothetical protein